MTNVREQEKKIATAVEVDQWITYEQAKQVSGLGRTKLWELISAGQVEAAKVGRAVRISRRGLDEYMRRNSYAGSKK